MSPLLFSSPAPAERPATGPTGERPAEDGFGTALEDAVGNGGVPEVVTPMLGLLGGFLPPPMPTLVASPPAQGPGPGMRPLPLVPAGVEVRVIEHQVELPAAKPTLDAQVGGWIEAVLGDLPTPPAPPAEVSEVAPEVPVAVAAPAEPARTETETAPDDEDDSFDEPFAFLSAASDPSRSAQRVEAPLEVQRDTFDASSFEAALPGRLRLAIEDGTGGWELDLHRHAGVMDLVLRGDQQIRDVVDLARQELRQAIAVAGDRAGDVRWEAPATTAGDTLSGDAGQRRHDETFEQWRSLAESQQTPSDPTPRAANLPPTAEPRTGRLLDRSL